MRHCASFCLLSLMFLALIPAPAPAQQVYMDVTFDDQPLDAPLGTGGPAVGQASWIDENLELTVRDTPFATPCLEIHNSDLVNAHNFGFLMPGSLVSSGLVVVDLDFRLQAVGIGWEWWMGLSSLSSGQLIQLTVNAAGQLTLSDAGGTASMGTAPLGRPVPVRWAFSLDEGTYSAWVDGIEVVTDRAIGIVDPDVYRFIFICGWDAHADNVFWIDRLRVKDTLEDVAVDRATWGRVKRLYGS